MIGSIRVFALLILAGPYAFAQGGAISGTVKDDGGQNVATAYAVASPVGAPVGRQTYTAITDSKGNFAFSGMELGTYSICVQTPGGQHLDPCRWAKPLQVTVASGKTIPSQAVSVTKGQSLQLRIDDPKRLMTGIGPGEILVGILLPSFIFQPMRLTSSDPTGRTYEATIPFDTPVRVSITTSHLTLADQKGTSLSSNARAGDPATSTTLTVQGSKGGGLPPVKITVTGKQ